MSTASATCPLCSRRKGKRLCPARGETICSACCGSKRHVEIHCPEDCVFLTGAHAPTWDGRETERNRDARRVGPYVEGLTEPQRETFLAGLLGLTALYAGSRDLDDRLVAAAVSTYTKTVETRERGVLYEHQADDLRVQGLVKELTEVMEPRSEDGQRSSPKDRDLLAALRALGAALAATAKEVAGPTAFLDSASRLLSRSAQGSPRQESPPQIIIP